MPAERFEILKIAYHEEWNKRVFNGIKVSESENHCNMKNTEQSFASKTMIDGLVNYL
jgi:hypothetical protein